MSENLNPQIRDLEIGSRELTLVKIYPLSLGDQLEAKTILSGAFQRISTKMDFGMSQDDLKVALAKGEAPDLTMEGVSDVELVSEAVEIIKDDLPKVFSLVCPDADEDLALKMTNMQLAEFVEVVVTDNFAGPVKKLVGLFKEMFQKKEQPKKKKG